MITMSKFGSYGRLGNQLFQWAFLSSLARMKRTDLILPESDIFQYFKGQPKTGNVDFPTKIGEMGYAYDPSIYELDYSKDYDVLGYFQNERYFDEKVREEINFKHEFHQQVREKFQELFHKPTIALGVRRTDYTETGVYYNLPPSYYITALEEHFPDWRIHNLVFISDDLQYCKFHFGCLENAYFPETKDIEQMCLMSQCDNHIIGNSTFHWWAAWIGEKGKVIQPNHLFAGKLLEKYGDINFYSDRWIKHEHEGKKIDLKDVTFTIPVYHDHKDRKVNLDICLKLLEEFDTNVIIGEQGTDKFQGYPNYIKYDDKLFHRTKMLNDMARKAETPIIANWDCDVAVPPMQLLETVYKIRKGAEMVYPYEYNFIRLSYKVKDEIRTRWDLGDYAKYEFPNNDSRGKPSFGGAVLWNKQKYFEIGGENEYFISFGPEDVERMERAVKLGVRLERTAGDLYHFPHWCGPDSSVSNPYFKPNRALLDKQREMSQSELWEYINTWPWHSPYTEEYYGDIIEESIMSRDQIFPILQIDGNTRIVDVGCGVGQWGVGLENYTGIDYRIEKPIVKNYIEHDLRTPLALDKKFQVVLCLEVAEHLEAEHAEILVDNICSLVEDGGMIVFGAAIPFQGGNNHVNERWQTYWAEKFQARGFGGYQMGTIQDSKACLWYRQNICIYKKFIKSEVKDYVLPEYYTEIVKHLKRIA